MAWHLDVSVSRGEIDNRERGRITGRLWVHGLAEPVVLDLSGDAQADIAGCLLEFSNPEPTCAPRADRHLAPVQHGQAGDFTASKKMLVPAVPHDEARALRRAGNPVPEHWCKGISLEWYSAENGRLIVELPHCALRLAGPEWQPTAEDEARRARASEAAFAQFIAGLTAAHDRAKAEVRDHDEEWDEFDHEKFMRERDASLDKYGELMEKFMDHPDREEIIAREMGWERLEQELEHAPTRASDEDGGDGGWQFPDIDGDAMPDPEPNPLTEGTDWVRDESGHVEHPLVLRSFAAATELWRAVDALGGLEEDDDVDEMTFKFQLTTTKLAGALNSLAYDDRQDHVLAAGIVARLKRALNHLHECQAAMAKVTERDVIPAAILNPARAELFGLREEILRLMQEFRQL